MTYDTYDKHERYSLELGNSAKSKFDSL